MVKFCWLNSWVKFLAPLAFLFSACAPMVVANVSYPDHWWAKIDDPKAPSWEIMPDQGKKGVTVILSKRNELGILSNFSVTPFELNGKKYQSVEGLWQSMKFPEGEKDPRNSPKVTWPLTREQVEQMSSFEAKKAGDIGSQNMKVLGIDWVSYEGERFTYRTPEKGQHYQVIYAAMKAKLDENPRVKEVLLSTGDLILLPDHQTKPDDPPAWKYFDIWVELREQLHNQ